MLAKLFARFAPAASFPSEAAPIQKAKDQPVDLLARKAARAGRVAVELVRWDAAFSVNNGLIDEEHKAIIRLLNRLYTDCAGSSGALCSRTILDELSATVVRHFLNEEALLRENGCPSLEEHKMAHRAFIADLHTIAETMNSGATIADVKIDLLSFTRRLVIDHVLTMDQDMARYMR